MPRILLRNLSIIRRRDCLIRINFDENHIPHITLLQFYTDVVKRMTLDNTGKIGIGTEEPLSTLHIKGTDGLIIPVGDKFRTGYLYSSKFISDEEAKE